MKILPTFQFSKTSLNIVTDSTLTAKTAFWCLRPDQFTCGFVHQSNYTRSECTPYVGGSAVDWPLLVSWFLARLSLRIVEGILGRSPVRLLPLKSMYASLLRSAMPAGRLPLNPGPLCSFDIISATSGMRLNLSALVSLVRTQTSQRCCLQKWQKKHAMQGWNGHWTDPSQYHRTAPHVQCRCRSLQICYCMLLSYDWWLLENLAIYLLTKHFVAA